MNRSPDESSLPSLAGNELREEKLSVRANWFAGVTGESDRHDDDPFAEMTSASSRKQLTSESSREEFDAAWKRMLQWGNRLEAIGVVCPLRFTGECHCSSCPISQANDPDGEMSSLCKQGIEEEKLTMLERVKQLDLVPSGV